jgi:1-acyl-sn-glycerol-3-phosphate acyltransferase
MTRKVLGDDPFATSGGSASTDPDATDAKADAANDADEVSARSASSAPSTESADDPTAADHPEPADKAPRSSRARRERNGRSKASAKTTAATASAQGQGAEERSLTPEPTSRRAADAFGAEAAPHPAADHPPDPDYGRTLDREVRAEAERRGLVDEFRLVERWVRERIQPQPRGGERRKLPLEFLWRRWRDIAMRDRSDFVDEFGRDPMYAARVEPLLDFLFRRYFRAEIEGLDNIPHVGRALIVSNHSGTVPYDGAMIMYAVRRDHPARREVRPLVEDFVFHFPYLGTFINRIGGVRACQENAERLLRQDQLVAVFPEGIKGIGKLFRERYRLQRFGRGGFIKLALRTDSPIIPAAVVGAEEIHPMLTRVTWLAKSVGIPYLPVTPTFPWLGPLGLVPLPTKWYLSFGAPFYFNTEYGAAGADDRILVNRLSEQVRSRIQEMVDERLAHRRSVLFG